MKTGEVWQVGIHVYACGETTDYETLLEYAIPDLVYADPPPGSAAASLTSLLPAVAVPAARFLLPFAVECPVGSAGHLLGLLLDGKARGLVVHEMAAGVSLITGTFGRHVLDVDFAGADPGTVPRLAMRAVTGGMCVLNPASGGERTALAAHECGWTGLIHEPRPARMKAGLRRLAELTGMRPARLADSGGAAGQPGQR